MAYNPTPAINPGDLGTSAWAQIVKGNFDASAVAVVAVKGDLAVATGVTALARLAVGADGTMLIPDSTGAGGAAGMRYQIQPACRVYNNANLDPATGAWVELTFNTVRWDMETMQTAPGVLTAPAGGAGIYHIGGNVEFETTGGVGQKMLGLQIYHQGANVIAQRFAYENVAVAQNISVHISCDYYLAAGETIRLRAYTEVNVDVLFTAQYSPEFWATWIRH